MKKINFANLRGDVPKGSVRVLMISAAKDGFWRGGIQHSRKPTRHAIADLRDEQITQIMSEKKLTVEVVDEPAEKPKK